MDENTNIKDKKEYQTNFLQEILGHVLFVFGDTLNLI